MVWDVVMVREGIQSWAGASEVVGPRLDKSVGAGDIDELVGVKSRCVDAFSRQHPRRNMNEDKGAEVHEPRCCIHV